MTQTITPFECDIECVADDSKEGLLPDNENSVPLKATFYLEDVKMWKETIDPDYPVRVYTYDGSSYGIFKMKYSKFNAMMHDWMLHAYAAESNGIVIKQSKN
jgi:DUF971 family protein